MKKLSEVMKEQHREKGRFKPTVPRNVPNKVVATPKLDERCWTGYRQIGMKKKGDRMVPNCVQDSVEIPTDAPSIQSIAKKHGVSEEEIQKQLEMGIKVEKEHTSDIQAATEIALDHLNEKPDYYTRLKTIGEASAAAIAAATAISKKKSGNYDKKGFRKTPYKNPDHPKAKSNEQRRQEMNEEVGGKEEMQVQGSAALTLTSRPNKEPMKTYKDLKQITELSADLLHRYKEKAAADASAADKAGDYKRGDKRFSGVIRATHKQFDKFKKKGFSEEAEQIDEISAQAHKEYQAAARKDVASLAKHTGGEYGDIAKNIINRRIKGMTTSSALQSRDRLAKINKEEVEQLEEKNVPTSPEKWARAKAMAKSKFDVYPSAYANGWAAKKYKEMGGGWKSVNEAKADDVGEMIKDKLKIIINRAQEMHDGIDSKTDMPEWVKSKITLAQDYISTACDYSCGKEQLGEEVEQIDELSKSTLASYATKAADQARVKKDAAIGFVRSRKGLVSTGEIQKSAKADKRIEGVKGAIKRLAKEEIEQIDEVMSEPDYNQSIKARQAKADKDKPPFEPQKTKPKAVPGKHGAGYSTARHLARMAMKKQVEGMKKMPVKEETRKAAIVKEVLKKKKSDDAFQKEPEMSSTLTKV